MAAMLAWGPTRCSATVPQPPSGAPAPRERQDRHDLDLAARHPRRALALGRAPLHPDGRWIIDGIP